MGGTEVFAPAKVNLHLSVGGIGADGYHEVTTVLQALELGDAVTLTEADALSLECTPDIGVPDAENLAYRAAVAFAAACGRDPGVAISLRKTTPHGAGLGGGSSDAAAVIRGLARMWGVAASDTRLRETAASLGADVPFFLGAPAALMSGRGDVLVRELDAPVFHVVVVWPRVPVPTAGAYAALDASPPTRAEAPDALIDALEGGDWRDVATHLHNDMTDAAVSLAPVVGEVLAALAGAEGVVGSCMCGSGSGVFGICATEADARNAADAARGRGWWAAATQSAGGAETVGWNARRGSRSAAAQEDAEAQDAEAQDAEAQDAEGEGDS